MKKIVILLVSSIIFILTTSYNDPEENLTNEQKRDEIEKSFDRTQLKLNEIKYYLDHPNSKFEIKN